MRSRRGDDRDRLLEQLALGVADRRVLDAMAAVPRELFVRAQDRRAAWRNRALPIAAGQTISQPYVVARMCELLSLSGAERVLDVGTGSGYHAAVLAQLAGEVWTIERHRELSEQAAANLAAAGIENVTLVVGDGALGHPQRAPFDAINVAAAAQACVPPALEQQLAVGGRLVIPVVGDDQRLVLVSRTDGAVAQAAFDRVRFVPLVASG